MNNARRHWKFLGWRYTRVNDMSVLQFFNMYVWQTVGNRRWLLGLEWEVS